MSLAAADLPYVPTTFTADGRFIVTFTPPAPGANPGLTSTGLYLWPVPPASSGQPLPDWLMRLASAVAGGEIDRNGVLQDRLSGAEVFDQIRAELAALPDDAPYVEWGRWHVADRATRPIALGLKLTAGEADKLVKEPAASAAAPTSSTPRR